MFILCDLPTFPLRQKANRAGNALTQKLLLLQYDSFPLVFNTAFFFGTAQFLETAALAAT